MFKLLKNLINLGAFFFIISICFVGIIFFYYSNELPNATKLKNYHPELVSKIYASNGQLLEQYAEEYRLFVPISDIPKKIIYATLAAEDADFYHHPGIDVFGIGRAIISNVKNIKKGKSLVGGSTITQQVAKNLLLTNEKSLERKIKEAILSLRINNILTKDEILELYLNHIYLGNRSYGITTAAAKYFNKDLEALTLAESALLASLPKAPSYYNPKLYKERVLNRRNWVLKQMYEKHFITKENYEDAIQEPIIITDERKTIFKAGYFSNEVRNIIGKMYGERSLFVDGLIINTTIIPKLQITAQQALSEGILKIDKTIKDYRKSEFTDYIDNSPTPEINGALVVVHNNSGRVVALTGGYNFDHNQFNRATQAMRQSGSVFKPFIYMTALENGFSPVSEINDTPIAISQGKNQEEWMPKNYSDDFLGNLTLRRSLELSRNVATVKVAKKVGIKKISQLSKKFGVVKDDLENYSAALGAHETRLIDIASGYASIANGGKLITPVFIETIQNQHGKVIFRNPNLSCHNCHNSNHLPIIIDHKKRVASEESSFQMINILQGAVQRGTSRRAKVLNINIAAKTGTTNDNKDAWFVGFTPEYTIAVYVGYDAPKSIGKKATGATIALPIFVDFVKNTKWFFKDRPFKTPKNIRMIKINYKDGTKADENTKFAIFEAFKKNEQPNEKENPLKSDDIALILDPDQIY